MRTFLSHSLGVMLAVAWAVTPAYPDNAGTASQIACVHYVFGAMLSGTTWTGACDNEGYATGRGRVIFRAPNDIEYVEGYFQDGHAVGLVVVKRLGHPREFHRTDLLPLHDRHTKPAHRAAEQCWGITKGYMPNDGWFDRLNCVGIENARAGHFPPCC